MATSSFYTPLIIDTDEKAMAMIAAYEASLNQEPMEDDGIDIMEELKRGDEFIKKIFSAKKEP